MPESLAFIIWAGLAALLLASEFLGATLFQKLAEKHAAYYKKQGSPLVSTGWLFTDDDDNSWSSRLNRAFNGAGFVASLAIRGIPKDFPKDAKLRKYATTFRYVCIVAVLATLTGFFLLAAFSNP